MKRYLLITGILLTAFSLYAQSPTVEQRAKQLLGSLPTYQLKLTDEQSEKLMLIQIVRVKKMDQQFNHSLRSGLSNKDRMSELTAFYSSLDKETDKKILEVLNFDQRMIYLKSIANRQPGGVVQVVTPVP